MFANRSNRNTGSAGLGLDTGAGKGDKDRSPGWRDNYDEVNWGKREPSEIDGFIRKGNKQIKYYKI